MRLNTSKELFSRIDLARTQQIIGMSAPLIREMSTALRKSADVLDVTTDIGGSKKSIFFLDRDMANEFETSFVDKLITQILGNIIQFNKDTGWGKISIEDGNKIVNFNIPYNRLSNMRQRLIDSMHKDKVFLQTYFVRNKAGDVIRLIAVDILPTPQE
jgi:hypothetical protein